ncbi:MAG: PAS domain-containing protein, partial [Limisphaerales bacterium]
MIAGLGCARLSISRGPNFEFLYLFCCAVIGWLAGTRAGLASVVLSACLLFVSEVMRGQVASVWIFVCDSVLRFLAFGSITWLVARVGRESRELGRMVVQRTARLRSAEKQNEQTYELLLEATQLFRQVTENITDVFWVTDPSRREVEYISPGFERLWGKPCQDLYTSPSAWVEGIYHEDRERVTRSMFTRQVTGEYDEEYRVVRTDGSIHWVHDRAFPVRDESGAVYRLVGIAEDIT